MKGLIADDPGIPEALRMVYATFGDPMTPFGPIAGQDSLSGPFDLTSRGDYVHFLSESQSCWSCAYRVDGGADPAVYLFGDGPEPVKQSDSLEEFLVTCLLQESVMAAPHFASQEDGILPEDALRAPVEPLWLEAVYASPNPTHGFYWCKDAGILVMRFDGDYAPWLWLGTYEDRWDSALRDCQNGYVVTGPSGDERRVGCVLTNPSKTRRMPRWLRWLE